MANLNQEQLRRLARLGAVARSNSCVKRRRRSAPNFLSCSVAVAATGGSRTRARRSAVGRP